MNINDIATLATKVRKPTERKAFRVIREMIENDSDEINIEESLALLYSYFLPPLAKPKTPEQWLMLAMGKTDIRFYLNYCYSDGKNFIASDGHRAHLMKTDKPKGFYNSAGDLVEVGHKYPSIYNIIPKGRAKKLPDDIKVVVTEGSGYQSPTATNIHNDTYVQTEYLNDALSLGGKVKYFNADRSSAVRLDFDDGRKAMIMPVRVRL